VIPARAGISVLHNFPNRGRTDCPHMRPCGRIH
jgi:hypothetical protein